MAAFKASLTVNKMPLRSLNNQQNVGRLHSQPQRNSCKPCKCVPVQRGAPTLGRSHILSQFSLGKGQYFSGGKPQSFPLLYRFPTQSGLHRNGRRLCIHFVSRGKYPPTRNVPLLEELSHVHCLTSLSSHRLDTSST